MKDRPCCDRASLTLTLWGLHVRTSTIHITMLTSRLKRDDSLLATISGWIQSRADEKSIKSCMHELVCPLCAYTKSEQLKSHPLVDHENCSTFCDRPKCSPSSPFLPAAYNTGSDRQSRTPSQLLQQQNLPQQTMIIDWADISPSFPSNDPS